MISKNLFPISLFACIFFVAQFLSCASQLVPKEIFYVGTFADQDSQGLYVFEFDRSNGELNQIQTVSDREGPSFQAIHPDGNFLYSISGESMDPDSNHGTVSAYRIDQSTGKLSIINEQSAEGQGACHVSIDPRGRFVYVSNYSEGNLSVYSINQDGSLEEASDVVQHEGHGPNENRQNSPHMHSIIPSEDGKFIYASDLGIDKVMIYEVSDSGTLTPAEVPYVENTPGSGPRHFAIHPNGNFAYSAEELSYTVAAFSVDKRNGALSQIQRVSMLPDDYQNPNNSAADIHFSPDGKYLYASNRGHDSIVIYSVDPSTGFLSLSGHEPTRGGHPRNFGVDQKGEYLFVANRDDNNVVFFNKDNESGLLEYAGIEAIVPKAVCVTQHFLK
ncbi:MAG: lactonase family protein [Balneolales bacterium]